MDSTSRASPEEFIELVGNLQNITIKLRHFQWLLEQHATFGELSAFEYGQDALQEYVHIVVKDIQKVYEGMEAYHKEYQQAYGLKRSYFIQMLTTATEKIATLIGMEGSKDVDGDVMQYERNKTLKIIQLLRSDRNNILYEHARKNSKKRGILTNLPSKINLIRQVQTECHKAVNMTFDTLGFLGSSLTSQTDDIEYSDETYKLYLELTRLKNRVESCTDEYSIVLSDAKFWFENNDYYQDSKKVILDYEKPTKYGHVLSRAIKKYESLFRKVSQHTITKLEVAQKINKSEVHLINGLVINMTNLVDNEIYMVLEKARSEIMKSSNEAYLVALQHLEIIQRYFDAGEQYDSFNKRVREMTIWRKPFILTYSNGRASYELDNVTGSYEVWPREKSFADFVHSNAKRALTDLIDNYMEPVGQEMSQATSEISLHAKEVTELMNIIHKSMKTYVDKSENTEQNYL